MCKSSLHSFLQKLPKCEHHMHVEGALTPSLLFSLAARNNIILPSNEDSAFTNESTLLARYSKFTSLDDFLHYYYIGMRVLVKPEDFEALAWSYLERAHADGVVHAEIFFDPQAHLERGISYSTVISGLSAACRRAESSWHMSTALICCFLRHLPAAAAQALFNDKAVLDSFASGVVSGIGLDSSEKEYPPELFTELYAQTQQLGIRRTAHAGEEGPAQNVATAVDMLKVQRVDHGITLANDAVLMAKFAAAAKETPSLILTVCPLSNVFLRCVPDAKHLPIRTFLDAGIPFSINSDDPAYFGGFLLDNYCVVQEAFELSVAEWRVICSNAIEGSWCGEARKVEMRKLLDEVCAAA